MKSLPRGISRTKKTERADLYCEAWVEGVWEKVTDLFQERDSRIDEVIRSEDTVSIKVKRRARLTGTIQEMKTIRAGLSDGAEAQVFLGVNKTKTCPSSELIGI